MCIHNYLSGLDFRLRTLKGCQLRRLLFLQVSHLLSPSKFLIVVFEELDAQLGFRYIVSVRLPAVPDDDSAEGTTNVVHSNRPARDPDPGDEGDDEPPAKRKKLTGAQRKKLVKEEKKKNRGANKGRKFGKVTDEVELCWKLASGLECEFGEKSVVLRAGCRAILIGGVLVVGLRTT